MQVAALQQLMLNSNGRSRLPDEIVYGDGLNAAQQSLIRDYQNAAPMLYGYGVIKPEAQIHRAIAIGKKEQTRTAIISRMGFGGGR